MLVRLLTNIKGDDGERLRAGEHDLPDAQAKALIEAGLAEQAKPAKQPEKPAKEAAEPKQAEAEKPAKKGGK